MKKSTKEEKPLNKNITFSDWEKNTPSIVMFLIIASYFKMPVGSSLYERATKEHPEYFYDGGLQLIPKNN